MAQQSPFLASKAWPSQPRWTPHQARSFHSILPRKYRPDLVWKRDEQRSLPLFPWLPKGILECVLGYDWKLALEGAIEWRSERSEPIEDYAASLRHFTNLAFMDLPRSEREERLTHAFARGLRDPIEKMQCINLLNERAPIENLLGLIRQYRSANSSPDHLTIATLPLIKEPHPSTLLMHRAIRIGTQARH